MFVKKDFGSNVTGIAKVLCLAIILLMKYFQLMYLLV